MYSSASWRVGQLRGDLAGRVIAVRGVAHELGHHGELYAGAGNRGTGQGSETRLAPPRPHRHPLRLARSLVEVDVIHDAQLLAVYVDGDLPVQRFDVHTSSVPTEPALDDHHRPPAAEAPDLRLTEMGASGIGDILLGHRGALLGLAEPPLG